MLTLLRKIYNSRAREKLKQAQDQHIAGFLTKQPTSVGLRLKVTRANGKEEPERLASYAHRNFFINAIGAPFAYYNGMFWNWYYTRKRRTTT